jgi:hypothetical protein
MPPKSKSEPTPDKVEQLALDVADEKLEYPEGTPVLIPVLNLPRMRRADAYEALGQIQDLQRRVKSLKPEDDDEPADDEDVENPKVKPVKLDPLSYGTQYRVLAYIEEYLAVVAKDPKEFREWAQQADDSDLTEAFNVYIRKTQPGEAESSTG